MPVNEHQAQVATACLVLQLLTSLLRWENSRVLLACNCRAATPTPSASDAPAAAAAAAAVAAAAAAAASRGGPSWQQVALAQAGLLMLLDADFESGLSVLQELPLEVWQPCQLFSLFPALMARWADRGLWGRQCCSQPAATIKSW